LLVFDGRGRAGHLETIAGNTPTLLLSITTNDALHIAVVIVVGRRIVIPLRLVVVMMMVLVVIVA